MMCPSGEHWENGQCVPGEAENPRPPTGGGCPPGQVPKNNGQGCKPEGQWWDNSPDELSQQGQETCDEADHPSPKECYWCDFDTRTWKRGYCPGGGSGGTGGTGGGSGGGKTAPFSIPDYGTDIENEINGYLRDVASGKMTRWNPEAMAAAKGQLKTATEGGAKVAREQTQFDLIRSGMNRSPAVAGKQYADIRARTNEQYNQGATKLVIEKANADFQDRMTALNAMSQQLEQSRSYRLSKAMTELEARRINNAYDIALRNISMQQAQLNQQWNMFGQQMGLSWAQLELARQQAAMDALRP